MPKLGYKYLNFQILVIKIYLKKISAHNLSGGADTQNFSHTRKHLKKSALSEPIFLLKYPNYFASSNLMLYSKFAGL